MSSEKSLAIVLKVVDYSESSVVISLFTESFGKISALAKGARRPKSAFFGAVDTLSLSQVIFLPRRSGALDLLTESKLVRRYRPSQWSLGRLYAGYYVVELLHDLTEPHQPLTDLFSLAVQTLDDLQRRETDFAYQLVSAILLRFELRMLHLLGHGLGLTHCVGCDRSLIESSPGQAIDIESLSNRRTGKIFFSPSDTSLVCGECAHHIHGLIPFSLRAAEVLRRYQGDSPNDWRELSEWGYHPVFRDLVNRQWFELLGKKPRLLPAILQLVRKERQRKRTH